MAEVTPTDEPSRCDCDLDGSYRFSCPRHGKRNTLVRQAEWKLRDMTDEELVVFLASIA